MNDLAGVSDPLVGSTARPSVSRLVALSCHDGARGPAIADLDHDDLDVRLDAPAVGEHGWFGKRPAV